MVDVTKLNVQCTSCSSIVSPSGPKYKLHLTLLGAFFLGALGFAIGGVIGIATAGAGITATVPLTIIGLVMGYSGGSFLAKLHDGVSCPKCGNQFGGVLPWR